MPPFKCPTILFTSSQCATNRKGCDHEQTQTNQRHTGSNPQSQCGCCSSEHEDALPPWKQRNRVCAEPSNRQPASNPGVQTMTHKLVQDALSGMSMNTASIVEHSISTLWDMEKCNHAIALANLALQQPPENYERGSNEHNNAPISTSRSAPQQGSRPPQG